MEMYICMYNNFIIFELYIMMLQFCANILKQIKEKTIFQIRISKKLYTLAKSILD